MKDRNWLTVCTLIVVNLPAAIRVVRSADRGYFYSAPSPGDKGPQGAGICFRLLGSDAEMVGGIAVVG